MVIIMTDIKDTISKITKTITKTSGEVIKNTKLNISLSSEEENLKKIYYDIGKKVHEIYMYGGTLGKFFDEKYKEIVDAEEKISKLREEIDSVKGTKTCPKCGKSVDKLAGFCPKCGFKMDKSSEDFLKKDVDLENLNPSSFKEPPTTENFTEESKKEEIKICSVCKYENKANEKFCISCGRLL